MLLREIEESAFFRGAEKQGSPIKTAGVILKAINFYGVYGGNFSWLSSPDINTAVVLVNLS